MTTGRPPGRPATAPELRILRGAKPQTAGPTGTPVSELPVVPPTLGAAGRAAWERYWQHGRPWLAQTDVPLLERLCGLIDDAARMRATIEAEGLTHVNPRTKRSAAHPLLNVVLGLSKQVAALEAACGFTPSDRGRLNLKADDADDPFTRWMRS